MELIDLSNPYFNIITVNLEDSIRDEALGTKDKFWVNKNGELWLFKESRANTGEDWSEKVAAEIAGLLGIPAAKIELADCDGIRGTLSLSFINRDTGEDLIHGNEILAGQVLGYDPEKNFGQCDHTLENIRLAVIKLFPVKKESELILKRLASYLVLDALIGNVDRHHENWGLVGRMVKVNGKGTMSVDVAPTFDHASCLGRELLDAKILRILDTEDGVENYINKGRGAIYLSPSSPHGENPLRLVEFGSRQFPEYFNEAIDIVKNTPLEDLLKIVDKIPEDRISEYAIQFVKYFLTHTYSRLCKLND